MRVRLLAAALLFLGSSALCEGQQPRLVLVELFTSEGCSSCPPADELLRRLDGMRVESGQIVVGISEHVTYWNQLGWADPFSSQTYTQRQSSYGDRFRLDSVYTPQIVVNGAQQVLGSDGAAVLKAVALTPARTPVTLRIDSIANPSSARTMLVTFSLDGQIPEGLDIFAVIADDAASSSVSRGENSGHTLKHVSVARSFTRVATTKEAKMLTFSLPVPGLVKGQPETRRHLILFAQESGQGKVLAIERKPL